MAIEKLQISDFRNIESAHIQPSPSINIIYGDNASGKSSFLEALHILLTSKSFRTNKVDVVIRHGQEKLQVISSLHQDNQTKILGIEKSKSLTNIKFAGESIRSAAKLAHVQPVVLLTPECHQLVIGSPVKRRRYLDWLLFHVEHSYFESWFKYNKILKQRNALLRKRKFVSDLEVWDSKLVDAGVILDQQRNEISSSIIEELNKKISSYFEFQVNLTYDNGWGDIPFSDVIKNNREKDLVVGYTRKGPHRADLLIRTNGQDAVNVLSRGQTKLLAVALEISKVTLLHEITGKTAIVLVDDLPAELDSERKERIIEMLSALDMQLFITATEIKLLPETLLKNSKMFHVKHGCFQEVVY